MESRRSFGLGVQDEAGGMMLETLGWDGGLRWGEKG